MDQSTTAPKEESAYPQFDELAFAMLNDLMFFSGITKHIYFTMIGMSTEQSDWGVLRSRVKTCETWVYSLETHWKESEGYELVLTELQSIFMGCLATAERLDLTGVTPLGQRPRRGFQEKDRSARGDSPHA